MSRELFFSWIFQLNVIWSFLAIISTLIVIVNSIYSLIFKSAFKTFDLRISLFALIFNHIQIVIGIILYLISPKFLWWGKGFNSVFNNDNHRRYLIEHPLISLIGVLIITFGWSIHKKSNKSSKKFLIIGLFYLIGFFLLTSKTLWKGYI